MAQRFELSISPNYVPDWTEIEAVREIFQNALDAETQNVNNKMGWDFSKEDEVFIISSKNSFLTKDTLLLGVSSKRDENSTIGVFGEGYKLALLVLVRLGFKVTIYNSLKGEVWEPKMIQSRRFNSKILVIDVKKSKGDFPDGLTFVIEGIHAGIISNIGASNLHMSPAKEIADTSFGSILLDDNMKGKIFVNGLLICLKGGMLYGYNIKPEFLTIGRDRDLITDFDLSWVTSQMWRASRKPGLAIDLIKGKAPDTSYISSFEHSDGEISEAMYADFIGNNGRLAIPVSSQEEYDTIKKSYKKLKPVIVESGIKTIISYHSDKVVRKATKRKDVRAPHEVLEDFQKKIKKQLSNIQINEFNRIIKKAKGWELK